MAAVVSVSPPRRRLASSRWLGSWPPTGHTARLRPWSWRRAPFPLWMVPTLRWPPAAAAGGCPGRSEYSRARWSASRIPAATTASIGYCSMAQAAISATTQALMIASGAPCVVRDPGGQLPAMHCRNDRGCPAERQRPHGRADAAAIGGVQLARRQKAPHRCLGGRTGTPHLWQCLGQPI